MAYNTIVVKGYPMRKENVANETITPGHLITLNSSNKLIKHATAAGNTNATFAIENEVFGKGVDDNYVANDNVLYGIFQPGDEVLALVAASAGAIVIGDYLESAGNGTLRKVATAAATADTGRASIIAKALQAVDNSGGATPARILVEIV
jgi:hypothetical protein